jgi:hypothetical protein
LIKKIGNKWYDSPEEVLQKKKKEFYKSFYRSIFEKIGANKTKDSLELTASELKQKFAD